METDYKKLGFRCGIEIHRQLASEKKLFCSCLNEKSDDFPYKTTRNLRAVAGELGKIDRAALHEAMRSKTFIYNYNPKTSCLVELDEEPPHEINREAMDIALTISLMLNMKIVDELHVMRKTVVDGSSVSGFQRTALLGYNGYIDTEKGKIGIVNLSIEEDSAPKILEEGNTIHYRLDRLGVPLVEIGTDTDIISPDHCKEVAEKLGMLLKSTGKVKRGIGTIRQDVNVSIKRGARTEIKGAQDLRMLPELVRLEVKRQESLAELRDELEKMKFKKQECNIQEVTDIFRESESRIVRDRHVYAIEIKNLAGFFKRNLHKHRTLGNEIANYARVKSHIRGIIHTDENLQAYGLESEFEKTRDRLKAASKDIIIIAAGDRDTAWKALSAVCERVNQLIDGIPEETRRALPSGDSEYLRPLPGASRMYPETDIHSIPLDSRLIGKIKSNLPETMDDKQERFRKKLGLNAELSLQIVNSDYLELFEKCVKEHRAEPKLAANLFVNTLPDLRTRENIETDKIKDKDFFELFDLVTNGKITKDVIPVILKYLAESDTSVAEVMKTKSLGIISEGEAEKIIKEVLEKEKGAQMKYLIGKCMGALKGKIENKKIVEIIKREMKK